MNGTTPGEIEAHVQQAWQEVLMEFTHCSGAVPEGAIVDKVKELFAKTIENGIRNGGALWEEPIRSYALHHVCKVGKRAKARGYGDVTTDSLESSAQAVVKDAKETCQELEKREKVKAEKIGVLCRVPL